MKFDLYVGRVPAPEVIAVDSLGALTCKQWVYLWYVQKMHEYKRLFRGLRVNE